MAASTSVPYDWLRHIPHSLLEKDEVPIMSSPGPFPWDKLTAFLAKTFQLEKLEINPGQWEPRSDDNLSKGLGTPVKYLSIELSPVQGLVTWAMSEKDIKLLMSIILTKEPRTGDLIDPEYLEGFFEFVAMETLLSFNRSEYDKGLVPHLLEEASVPADSCLCMDVNVNCNGTSLIGRIILSEEFRHSWKDRYTQHKMSIEMAPEIAQKMQVIIHLEAGRSALSKKEWASVHPGDYIPLDNCSFEPGTDKSRVMMTLNGQTLFRAKIKQGNIKILEFPLYHEVETVMSKDDDDDDDMDEYFDDSELEESGEFHEDDDDDDDDDDDFDDDLSSDEHSVVETATPPPVSKAAAAPPKAPSSTPATAAPHSGSISPEDIQLTVVVEVGRLQMSIQKLMELQPGNLLELDVHPENGVDLVVNGKCIGRGELLRIGDSLGVRVLDKG